MDYQIRQIRTEEIPQLKDFLYEAIFIPEGVAAPPREIVNDESLQVYIRDFGNLPDDRCLVAVVSDKVVGAIWSRIMNDYGHIADDVPSIAISLYKEYRNRGIGSQLLNQMLALLKADGYKSVSLSVQKANYAMKMYQKAGFTVISDDTEEAIMKCDLLQKPILF
jgi:ribosomal protein S18 acetylase RimI-like enzyme